MYKTSFLFLALASSIAVVPVFADDGKDESGKGKERGKQEHRSSNHGGGKHQGGKDREPREYGDANAHGDRERETREGGGHFSRSSHSRIPSGHLPPPGECRLWYPDRPPGHQPPPYKCGSRAPAGAWVLQRPAGAPQQVEAIVYDTRRPGVVVDVGIFDSRTGSFIKIQGAPR